MIEVRFNRFQTVRLSIGDVVVFDCYDNHWAATAGKITGFEMDERSSMTWVWLECSDGSFRKRAISDLKIGLMRKVF